MNNQIITGIIKSSSLSATIYGGMSPGESQSVLIPKTINQNGVYAASDDNADGYSAVTVNVQSDNTNYVIKDSNNILKYNKVYLGDVWAAYGTTFTTPSRVEHIENGDFITGNGSIWRMNNGVIQPTGMNDKRSMTFTQPITLTTETTLNITYSYNSSYTYRSFWVSLFENVDPATIRPGGNPGFGTGDALAYIAVVNWGDGAPAQASSTVKSIDISALQGKTIWIHLFTIDVIPLISEIWFE